MTESRVSHRALQAAIGRVADRLAVRAAPASATVVLVPFAQLLPLARKAWVALGRSGFSPRFETTQSWAARMGPVASTAPSDTLHLSFDPAHDLLVAQQLLATARAPASLSPTALLEAATELARRVAAVPPEDRSAWLAARRAALPLSTDSLFTPEAMLARLALEWACATSHAADALWQAMRSGTVHHVFVLEGLQPDPLVQAWQQIWPLRVTVLPLLLAPSESARHTVDAKAPKASHPPGATLQLHQATDVEDEAQRTAACVIRHLQASRVPVALASTDRVVSRRVQALLTERGIGVRDETGWRLSTTRAAATLWRTVELWSPEPSTDGVIDWLQHVARQAAAVAGSAGGAPAAVAPALVAQLEARARKVGQARWPAFAQTVLADQGVLAAGGVGGADRVQGTDAVPQAHVVALVQQVERWRLGGVLPEGQRGQSGAQARGQARRPLAQWLLDLRGLLQTSGLWDGLRDDVAGAQVLDALRLQAAGSSAAELADLTDLSDLPVAARPMPWSAWTHWVRAVLEHASFRPPGPAQPDVVLLPLAQFAGRDFAAAVLPGCDEAHLPQVPAVGGVWTRAQREVLGLATATDLQLAQRQAWDDALHTPLVDVLWRRKDALGNPVSPSGLVERLLLQGVALTEDPRPRREVPTHVRPTAVAVASQCVPQRLSASAYADLRACPYRFFALRMLRLREDEEIDTAVDKRDFGSWLHRVLHDFHERLASTADTATPEQQAQWLDDAATQARRELGLSEAEFLPFMAAWPDLRTRYLAWWQQQQQAGVRFVAGEVDRERPLVYPGPDGETQVILQGRLDRMDHIHASDPLDSMAGPPAMRLVDYKTEAIERTRQRVRDPLEDTQMAFYAALVDPPDGGALQGGYLQLDEREAPRWVAQPDLLAARDCLIDGVVHDLAAIAAGATLKAMGSGAACEHCAARGLCRKDHVA